MVNIKDVAKAAGVAVSTASYALNGSSKVSEKTKEKIIQAAKELNYTPNNAARNLKTRKTNLIGLFVNTMNGPFYDMLIKGIQDVTELKEYEIIIFCDSGRKSGTSYNFLREGRVDGAIIISQNITDDQIISLSKGNLPIVVLDRKLTSNNLCSVTVDNTKGSVEAVKHLIDLGKKTIGFISGPENNYDNKERYKGYVETLKNNSMEVNNDFILKGKFTEESGYEAVKKYISQGKMLPDAFFSSNDEMALGAIKAFKEEGIKVPQDVAIVGFDDVLISSYISPKLTTVRRPMYELGSFSAHMLMTMLEGKPMSSTLVLSTELIIRESCGAKSN